MFYFIVRVDSCITIRLTFLDGDTLQPSSVPYEDISNSTVLIVIVTGWMIEPMSAFTRLKTNQNQMMDNPLIYYF